MNNGKLYYLDYRVNETWERLTDHIGASLVFRAGPQVGAAEMVFRALKPSGTSYLFVEVEQ